MEFRPAQVGSHNASLASGPSSELPSASAQTPRYSVSDHETTVLNGPAHWARGRVQWKERKAEAPFLADAPGL